MRGRSARRSRNRPSGQGEQPRTGLARRLSKLGYCSRSQATALIRAGRVQVNGRVQRDPESPTLGDERIRVDGAELDSARKIYLMMNKPRGLVTTASDEGGRDTVYSLLGHDLPWVAPVGRLDKASEGLLLLTNDSEWGAQLSDPESHIAKTYHVQIAGVADDALLQRLAAGVADRGERLKAKSAMLLRSGERNCWLEIVLEEGKNRHIRRMLNALDVEVLRLVRVAIGPLQLGELAKGQVRALSDREVRLIRERHTAAPPVRFG